jgi:glycosyltransferase involved in cell wall biosynthesis
MRQRPQYLMQALAAAGHPVWFVDPRLQHPTVVEGGIHLVPSLGPVPSSGVILYIHFAPSHTLVDRFSDTIVVYDLLDDLSIYDEDEHRLPERRRVRHHHRTLVKEADIVLASNPVLVERHRNERDDGILLVENGVDLGRFTPEGPVAPELDRAGPVAGFHGAIARWVDLDLVRAVAELRPSIRFVLVGPVEPGVEDGLERLLGLPNVHHLPEQPSDLIPSFVRGFDVGLVPFVVNEMTQGVTPLKMYEYLACGVPVVATPLPACRSQQGVETAEGPEAFSRALDRVLAGSDPNILRSLAAGASWERRIRPLLQRLQDLGVRSAQ